MISKNLRYMYKVSGHGDNLAMDWHRDTLFGQVVHCMVSIPGV